MKMPLSYSVLHNHFLSKLFKKTVVTDYHPHCSQKKGHVLIYFKTDGFIPGYIYNFQHCNTWEIVCIANIFNRLGYWVDIIDRSVSDSYLPENKYDIFLSNGSSDSSKHYTKYAKHLTRATKIYFAVNPNPEVVNTRLKQRYEEFTKRQKATLPIRRDIKFINAHEQMSVTDYIFSAGNHITNSTFSQFNKPLKKIFFSTFPGLHLDISAIKEKRRNSFLYFAGSGNMFKGLDLLLETFTELPNLHLHICAPLEDAFLKHYEKLLSTSPNIHVHGFILVGSPKFIHLTNLCGYITLLGCAEGTSTSVLTCMRRGLIPIVTPETGLDLGNFGIMVTNLSIESLKKQYTDASNMDQASFKQRIINSYLESFKYTQQTFERSFNDAILDVLVDIKMI